MYNINKRQQFNTVGDLKKLLSEVPDETKVVICGDDYCWFHIEEDKSVICLDCEDLEDTYDRQTLSKENDRIDDILFARYGMV